MKITQSLSRCRTLFGDRAATVFGDRVTTWSALADRVARLAAGLRKLGARPGDRIAILAANSDRYVEAYYAIAWAGCISVPFNTRWAPAEIDFAIEDSTPSIAIVDDNFAARTPSFAAHGVTVIGMDAAVSSGAVDLLIASASPMSDASGSDDDLLAIFYTGGTTGRSKGVMLSHANLIINFLLRQAVAPEKVGAVYLHTPPMFHLADANAVFGLTVLGGTHVILPSFDPNAAIDAIERHRVSALVLVPTMIGMLCDALGEREADLSSVRRLTYGASPISSSLLQRAMRAFPSAEFCQAYGQTELSPVATLLDHADHVAGVLRSAGRPIPGVEVRIVNEDMNEMEVGSVGEVAVRGPGVMLGYWRQPDLTAKTIVEGWLRTGDAGYFDERGYLFLVDRVKDMIVSGGENVYSAEVENALLSHPTVAQCAVIGVPDERWGEKVHAIVVLRDRTTVTADELLKHCEPLIANYKRPKSIDLRQEPLPLSSLGKTLKVELRKQYWSDKERSIA